MKDLDAARALQLITMLVIIAALISIKLKWRPPALPTAYVEPALQLLSVVVVIVTPFAMIKWPPGALANSRFVEEVDLCDSYNDPADDLACLRRQHEDAEIWGRGRGYSPRGYDAWHLPPLISPEGLQPVSQ